VFTKQNGDKFTAVLICVDDTAVMGNCSQAIADLKAHVHNQIHMKDMGELKCFLGSG